MNQRKMSSRKALGGVALAAAAAVAVPAPARAAGTDLPTFIAPPAGATFSVQPLAGIRGSTVTFTGKACSFDGVGGSVALLVDADSNIPVPETTAAADGTWTTSTTVPTSAREGRHQVLAKCTDASGKTAWTYPEGVYFVATPGVAPAVDASPNPVARGATLTAAGDRCLVKGTPGRLVVVSLFHGAATVDETEATVSADGHWKAEVPVPADARLANALVGAHCKDANGSIQVFYIPANVTVVDAEPSTPSTTQGRHDRQAAPPKPVIATPQFTG